MSRPSDANLEEAPATGGCRKPETYQVDMRPLRAAIDEYGPVAFLLTVSADGRPHCAAVSTGWVGETLVAECGAQTAANMTTRPEIAIVWPPPRWGEHSLIIDGTASLRAQQPACVAVHPTRVVRYPTPDPSSGTTRLECEPV
jgi:hypothetical protein